MPSLISQIVAQLESAAGALAGQQPASMVNPVYGQYSGFVNQYGNGAAGVDNFASQVLASNPNATLGDFYATYVLGTGNPANLKTPQDLEFSTVPGAQGAYDNLVNNSGYNVDTPLSSLVGGAGSTSANQSGQPGVASVSPWLQWAWGGGGSPTSQTPASGQSGGAGGDLFSGIETWVSNAAGSVGFVVLGFVLIVGALIMFANQTQTGRDVKAALLAAPKGGMEGMATV